MQAESDAALADGEAGKPMNTMHILTDKIGTQVLAAVKLPWKLINLAKLA